MSDPDQQVELEAAVLKRLLHHLANPSGSSKY